MGLLPRGRTRRRRSRVPGEDPTMMKYVAAATALRVLGSTPPTRAFYRNVLGNICGARKRAGHGLDPSYLVRGNTLLELDRQHGLLRDGMRLLEVGTGWLHFYSVFIALFFDVKATLTDIWDNRQFQPLQKAFADLGTHLEGSFDLTPAQRARSREVLRGIASASSFDELYALLGFTYVVDHEGALGFAQPQEYDLIVSFHVLEHIHMDVVERHAQRMARALKPTGRQLHQIGIDDHLRHYDMQESPKHYLRYSDKTWKRYFENNLQYFNRLQKSEWERLFEGTGMQILHEDAEFCEIEGLPVDARFQALNDEDLACTTLTLVMGRAPSGNGEPNAAPPG
jgi:SAM-dependent methyltransferase